MEKSKRAGRSSSRLNKVNKEEPVFVKSTKEVKIQKTTKSAPKKKATQKAEAPQKKKSQKAY